MYLTNLYANTISPIFISGKKNVLDLTSPGKIPSRFNNIIKQINLGLKIPLSLYYTKNERKILLTLIQIETINDIEAIVKNVSLVPQPNDLTSYLYIALSKL